MEFLRTVNHRILARIVHSAPVWLVAATLPACSEDPGSRAAVASVEISSGADSIAVGEVLQLTAVLRDVRGDLLTDREVFWGSSEETVATVSVSGLVRGVATGATVISAKSEGASDSAKVTVVESTGGRKSLTFDPLEPRWLFYDDGTPFFMVASGGPEGFLYDGVRSADGTRTGGRQHAIIDAAIAHGWNGIYLMVDRTGDGTADEHPWHEYANPGGSSKWDPDIIGQWHQWFRRMDRAGIVIFLILYDDTADPFGGTTVNAREREFITDLVHEFKAYGHLIWCIAEEYSEALTQQRASQLAALIRSLDPAHPIANHQLTGNLFDFADDRTLNQFAMQLDRGVAPEIDPDGIHEEVVEAWHAAAGRFNLNASELAPNHGYPGMEDRTRQTNWAAITGGAYVMVLAWWDDSRADGNPVPTALEQDQAGYALDFLRGIRFDLMEPADARASGDAEWVLAHRLELGNDHFLGYGRNVASGIGFTDMDSGEYALRWMDTRSGEVVETSGAVPTPGTHVFPGPSRLNGLELVLYARRLDPMPGPPSDGAGGR